MPYEPPADARELLFVSDYVLASLREALRTTYESLEKWWVIHGPFNGTLLCVTSDEGPPRSVYPVNFFRPGEEALYTRHEDPRRRLLRGQRMNLLIVDVGATDRSFPESLQETVRHAEEQGFEAWASRPEERDTVRRILFFTELRIRPDDDAREIADDFAERLAATLQGEWFGGNPDAFFHRFSLEGGSTPPEPDGALFYDFDFEVRLAAPAFQSDVVSALEKQFPGMQSPLFGSWGHIGSVEPDQAGGAVALRYARVVTRHF